MKWLTEDGNKTILHLYIQPGSSSTGVAGVHGERLKIKIKAPPQDGEANEALREFLADILEISKSKIEILRGESSRQKDLVVLLPAEKVKTIILKLLQ